MGIVTRLAVVSVVGIAVLLAILFEMSGSKEPKQSTTPVVEEKPVSHAEVVVSQPIEKPVQTVGQQISADISSLPDTPVITDIPVSPQEKPVEQKTTPPEKFHIVKKGETLYSIARANYGDSKMWTVIWNANKEVLSEPSKLAVGMRLRIPSPQETKEVSYPSTGETYIVQQGDSLSKIS
ncbi:MAG: LysM peptidoglycan-binding domain-containing protein, partial [Planctomycetota bacterium]|nr:LysM peptidoglycan-binding domain-containing protein [Planctomycetota bacterium]